jgi:hypothetical protein
MAPATTDPAQRTCFVVMGFGKKTDFETGRTLDLDKSYRNMIKPAVEAAGLRCLRADEIVHSGLIDVPMYEYLLNADVVVADLSTSNKNAFYELGVRHALRPFTTIIIAEDGIKTFPFDVNHVAVRQYHHLGEDIGYEEVMRFQKLLTQAIKELEARTASDPLRRDSPVYTLLQNLTPPALQAALQAAAPAAGAPAPASDFADVFSASTEFAATTLGADVGAVDPPMAAPMGASSFDLAAPPSDAADNSGSEQVYHHVRSAGPPRARAEAPPKTHSMLMAEVDEAQNNKDWARAKKLLEELRQQQLNARKLARQTNASLLIEDDQEDPYLLQRLALATYKSKLPTEAASLQAARELLVKFNIDTSNDTETLGLWGAIHKHRWDLAKKTMTGPLVPGSASANDLDQAVRAYERAFYLRNDHYNGIRFAFMLNVRAAESTDPADAIADFVQAQRVRREVKTICEQWLAEHPEPPTPDPKYTTDLYWKTASLGEAYIGLGQPEKGDQLLEQAYAMVPEAWMKDTTQQQIGKLRGYLTNSPLQALVKS